MYSGLQLKSLYREMFSITIFALHTGKCILDYIFHPIYREMCSGLQLLLHAKHCRGVAPPPTALVYVFFCVCKKSVNTEP